MAEECAVSCSTDLERKMTPKELLKYVKKIAPKWKDVGLELGLELEDIDIIATDHHYSCEEACKAMLFKWYKKNPNPTVRILLEAIEHCKNDSESEIPQVISDLGNYYRKSYKANGNNPKTRDWPPNQIKMNISVTLIHYKNRRTQEELLQIAERHEEGSFAVDSMALSEPEAKRPRLGNCKVTKHLSDIFAADPAEQKENSSLPQYILIEGGPGIGKTVLAHEIALQWANGKLLNKVNVLFLLALRDPNLWKVSTEEELVKLLTRNGGLIDIEVKDCTRMLLHSKGFQVAIVFDGLDEYPYNKNPFIIKFISEKIFPKAVVICTSRPSASFELHEYVDRRIEILGFTKEERNKYITMSLSDSCDKNSKLEKYLRDNPMIDDLCYIPLYLGILMYLFQEDMLPGTLTKLNELFTTHTVFRSLKKSCGLKRLNIGDKLRDLPENYKIVAFKLCKLAYEGVKSHQLVFTLDEIMKTCPEISDNPDGFGLLEGVSHYCTTGPGETTSYSFLHFTMQEFLAAYHVSTLSSDEQLRLLQQTFWNGLFKYMWVMYVGIVGVNSEAFSSFIGSHVMQHCCLSRDTINCLHLFQCYTEANSTEMPEVISSIFKDGKISFDNMTLFPHNFLNIICFLSKSNIHCKALQFDNCHVIGRDFMNELKKFVINNRDKLSTLQYLSLNHNFSSPWTVFCAVIKYCLVSDLTLLGSSSSSAIEQYADELMDSLQQNTTLQSLTLCSFKINELEVVKNALIKAKCPVKKLNISTRYISFEDISLNQSVLISTPVNCESRVLTINVLFKTVANCTVNSLELARLNVTDYEIGCVAFGLQGNQNVQSINVSDNFIAAIGISYIGKCLLSNSVITELNISKANFIFSSRASISGIISVNSSLLKLKIAENSIDSYEAEIIGSAIAENNTLEELDMSYCSINCVGADSIAQALFKNSSLQKLDLTANEISDNGAIAICKCLINNSSLQYLNISFNKVTNIGSEEMAKAIRDGTNFSKLNISGNRITSEGLITFLSTTRTNTALKTLYCQVNNVTKSGIFEIEQCIKELNILLEIHTSWNDIDTDHMVAAITTSYKSFNLLQPYSEISNISDDSSKWALGMLKDTDYALELLSMCLQENSSLKELYLRYVKVTSEGAKKIAEVLKVNKTLQKLDISRQSIGEHGVVAIGNSLKINGTLQELNMAGINIFNEGKIDFMDALKLNSGLVKLDLSDGFLSPSPNVINAISSYLQDNTSLQELNLSSSGISVGLSEIMKGLHENTTLQKLVLFDNYFHNMGTIICTFLKHNKTLLELDVTRCSIINEDVQKIAEGLTVNKTLHSLNISCNSLYDDGILYFSECLQKNCTLKQLDVSKSDIHSGKSNLFSAGIIQPSKSLQHLNISKNRFSFEDLQVISNYLGSNNTLLNLGMSECEITSSGAELIAEMVKVNTSEIGYFM